MAWLSPSAWKIFRGIFRYSKLSFWRHQIELIINEKIFRRVRRQEF
jgi:hypothetical protein